MKQELEWKQKDPQSCGRNQKIASRSEKMPSVKPVSDCECHVCGGRRGECYRYRRADMQVHKYQLQTPRDDVHLDHDVYRHTLHSLSWYPQTCQLLMSETAPCFEISRERQEGSATEQVEQIFRVSDALKTIFPAQVLLIIPRPTLGCPSQFYIQDIISPSSMKLDNGQ